MQRSPAREDLTHSLDTSTKLQRCQRLMIFLEQDLTKTSSTVSTKAAAKFEIRRRRRRRHHRCRRRRRCHRRCRRCRRRRHRRHRRRCWEI